jgi:hypothetical protein
MTEHANSWDTAQHTRLTHLEAQGVALRALRDRWREHGKFR